MEGREFLRRMRAGADKLGYRRARLAFGQATSRWRMLPQWIVVGAQRCGTSSLYEYLVRHPHVCRAAREEVHYFDNNYHRGLSWYKGHFALARDPSTNGRVYGGKVTGEASPYYLPHPLAIDRIAKDLPGVKIIVVLRNPTDRAYSHHYHECRIGCETLSFEEALNREPERLAGEAERIRANPTYYSFAHQNFSYVTRGFYADQMERLFRLFPPRDVLVICSERMARETAAVYAEVLSFLGLPDHTLRSFPRHSAGRYAPMNPASRARLQALFAPENERLFKLLGTDWGWNERLTPH